MRNLKQPADGEHPDLMLDSHEENPTLSEVKLAPAAFNQNKSNAVCLPVVSEGQKLIWVHSRQIDLQVVGVTELDKAFSRFPYLTGKQTKALAETCSLHPDQVKVWFMLQRLRYGISWDYTDIRKVRRKFRTVGAKKKPGSKVRDKNKRERKGKGDVKRVRKVREEQSGNKKRRNGEHAEKTIKQEHPKTDNEKKVDEEEKDKNGIMGTTRKKQEEQRISEGGGMQKTTQAETGVVTRRKVKEDAKKRFPSVHDFPTQKRFVIPDETLDTNSPFILQLQTQIFDLSTMTELKELFQRKSFSSSSTSSLSASEFSVTPLSFDGKTDKDKSRKHKRKRLAMGSPVRGILEKPQSHCYSTKKQLAIMKAAFLHCQYPKSEDFDRLEVLTKVPRFRLVQWFGDTRYFVKKRKPAWMSDEQYKNALANITYRQFLTALAKEQMSKGSEMVEMKVEPKTNE